MAEKDFIRLSEVIEAIDNIDWYHQNASKEMVSGANPDLHQAWYKAEDVYKALESVPSAQPEITRCKDCKHWQSEEYIGNNNVHTLNIASLPCKNWLTGGDWYCGSAERKDI